MDLEDHRAALLKLWTDNLSDARIGRHAAERLDWLYGRNPAGPARTWIAREAPGQAIVGCGSYYPRTTWVDGRAIPAGILADFAVDRAHRVAGAAVSLQRAVAKGCSPGAFLYGWPNRKSVGVFKRIGYQEIGETSMWVKPLRSLRFLKKRLPKAASRVASLLADPALLAVDLCRGVPALAGTRAEVVERADARMDELWQRLRPSHVMGEKTSAYLNWRYAGVPGGRQRFFCLLAGGSLAGYLVYSQDGGLAQVCDLLCPDFGRSLDRLLARFALHARLEGAAAIVLTYLGTDAFARRLRAHQFFERPTDRPLVVYVPPGAPASLRSVLLDRQRWFMLDGELDI